MKLKICSSERIFILLLSFIGACSIEDRKTIKDPFNSLCSEDCNIASFVSNKKSKKKEHKKEDDSEKDKSDKENKKEKIKKKLEKIEEELEKIEDDLKNK